MSENNEGGISSRAEEFLQIFKKGAEFTQGLLKENERLRFRVLELEERNRAQDLAGEVEQLRDQLKKVEDEKKEILGRISSVERENVDFANRYAEIEAENNLLANLYITTYQLHSTLDPWELMRVIEEILLNLVGADRFALLLSEPDGELLRPSFDPVEEPRLVPVEADEQSIRAALKDGETWIASETELASLGETAAKAVIPLKVDDEIIGVLAIYKLLTQKDGFSQIDEEIFNLLGEHAAMAISTAVLRRGKGGGMSFRQGFDAR